MLLQSTPFGMKQASSDLNPSKVLSGTLNLDTETGDYDNEELSVKEALIHDEEQGEKKKIKQDQMQGREWRHGSNLNPSPH